MDDEEVPKRRASDPKPGTRGPQRGNTDAFKVKEALERKPEPPPSKPIEGWLARERRVTRDKIIRDAEEGRSSFKKGGLVRGWGKARKKR